MMNLSWSGTRLQHVIHDENYSFFHQARDKALAVLRSRRVNHFYSNTLQSISSAFQAMGQGQYSSGRALLGVELLQQIDELAIRRLGRADFASQECIQPYMTAPYWTPRDVTIDASAEQAIAEHNTIACRSQLEVAVYTDGSGMNGRIGAAAVCPQYQETWAAYMGEQSKTTVYAAELQGIFLA
ncbi:hypothetical protein CBS63078_11038 [Aspergillus niger]|nr:hypothetical protein CBS63078_11038 [Aspergillus niger]KAI3015528.1 hypothetical protein CBS147347_11167 [Aspergillus niger]KAI3056535.1 hypothetical protein CBS147353_11177 [Aspergillus niger]